MTHLQDGPTSGQDTDPPSVPLRASPELVAAADEVLDDILGDGPPTSRTGENEPPPALSRFAVRDDGTLLLSLHDAGDRDLSGREVITFLVLNAEEAAKARATIDQGLSAAA